MKVFDDRLHDIEDISKNKHLQVIFWVLFFVILFVGIILSSNEMAHISKATSERSSYEPVKVINKLGEVIREHKKPRFSIDETGATIDWIKYWERDWAKHAILLCIVFLLAVILEIFIILQIKYLQKKELYLIYKYELEKSNKK
ncbi:hypothetical protein KAR04_01650 [Candidatus Calescamantes bacterium]|nr:hypothetical protein [Candidatus Calescamantes bacterium]MCK5598621.1 hypothetical protein [bacterium]